MTNKKLIRTTEADSNYQNLDSMSTRHLLENMNSEDQSVPLAVNKALPKIEKAVDAIYKKMANGGRLFYMGAGTSGRLGVVDASECPPTYGVPFGLVVGIIAGGDKAIRKAVEFAEDDTEQGWKDLEKHKITDKDFVVGIAASGTTPYVISALEKANENGIETGCITCNKNSPLAQTAKYPIEVIVGPEFVTGSTRMKAGTAQKLVLNMISTSVMVKLGRVKGNKMVDMRLSNNKLVKRGEDMLVAELGITEKKAKELLSKYGSVRKAVNATKK
ncbi:MAG: N-acetylmuramic acid 6-phosphate etherase [Bacteroidia bacterium]|nr:N-acetylmuramic acid 6-phosphate etherase [Bacteroidia bacterium]MCF8427436.1 N-acetylmuramic acid 6-phosphate etherase [Bacteroidia bacterium]